MLSPRIHHRHHDGICIEITSCPATSLVQPSLHHLPFLSLFSLPFLSFFLSFCLSFFFSTLHPWSGRSQVYFSVRCARSREIATATEASLLISNCRGPRGGRRGWVSRILALFSSQRRGKSLLCRESVSSPTTSPSPCPQPNPFHSVFRPFPPPSSPSPSPFPRRVNREGNRAESVSWNNGAGG